jgi:mono/diheme cytochrome c family protein
MNRILRVRLGGFAAVLLATGVAAAQSPTEIARAYEVVARQESPRFDGFSARRGEELFQSTHGREWSCASCHTRNPGSAGTHAKTGQRIAPLAPAANGERFTAYDKTEKWFRRNCNDVIGRPCTAQEKGDVLAYLMQSRP